MLQIYEFFISVVNKNNFFKRPDSIDKNFPDYFFISILDKKIIDTS